VLAFAHRLVAIALPQATAFSINPQVGQCGELLAGPRQPQLTAQTSSGRQTRPPANANSDGLVDGAELGSLAGQLLVIMVVP
jgi:hypothetical protein